MPEVILEGCTPEPLMSYLKALGVLRLVSEQADTQARACWRNDVFVLRSTLDREGLIDFFLNRYQPTPIIAPWGARSGFFPGSSESTARKALETLVDSQNPRLSRYQAMVKEIKNVLDQLGLKKKASDQDKVGLMHACRDRLPIEVLPWLDACYVLTATDRRYPPVLGTGGNEGSGSYVSGFAQCLVECVVERSQDHSLSPALFRDKCAGATTDQTPGHFAPGASGGANSGQGFEGPLKTNPWDYILCLEGTCLWASAVVRRFGQNGPNMAAFPFTVNVSGAGATGLDLRDSRKPKQAKRPVAEMWLPIWRRFSSLPEIRQLLSEGRASVGRRLAESGLDLAVAASSLGVERGIQEFRRVVFLMRNGQSFIGVPLGAFPVRERGQTHLLQEIDDWLRTFRQACRVGEQREPSARLLSTLHRIENSIFDFCLHGGTRLFQRILTALGRAERELARSDGKIGKQVVRPLAGLCHAWIAESNDGSPEFEIALALAGIYAQKEKIGPLRVHLEPVDWQRACRAWADRDRSVVWASADLTANLSAVLVRRLMDAQKVACESLPLASRSPASLAAISAFLATQTDDRKIEDLLWALNLVQPARVPPGRLPDSPPLPRTYALLKLLFLPKPLRIGQTEYNIPPEPQILPLLRADRIGEACRIAVRRLHSSGLMPMPHVRSGTAARDADWQEVNTSDISGKRLAAALLIPISDSDAANLAQLVLRPDMSYQTLPT